MTANLTTLGNDYALVLDKSLLQQLKIGPQTQFDVKAEDGRLVFTPVAPNALNPIPTDSQEEKFQQALSDLHARFGRAMKRLAE